MNAREQIEQLKARMQRSIVGQEAVVERLIIGLLANGNLLVEGLHGVAYVHQKDHAAQALAVLQVVLQLLRPGLLDRLREPDRGDSVPSR